MGVRGEKQNPAVSMRNRQGDGTWSGSPGGVCGKEAVPTGLQWKQSFLS